ARGGAVAGQTAPGVSSSQADRVVAEPFVASIRDQVIVLDADASLVGDVKARLERDHVARQQRLVGVANQEGCFGVAQAKPVTGMMREIVGHPGFLEDSANRLVHRQARRPRPQFLLDRKSTRLNSSHGSISYAVFCL